MELTALTSSFLALLWRASWQASVLVLLILLAQMVFGKRLAPKWRYALWLLVVVRLLLPVTPASTWSVFNVGNPGRFSVTGFDRWSRGEPWEVERESAARTSPEAQPANVTAATPSNITAPAKPGSAIVPSRTFLKSALIFMRQHVVWIWFIGVLALSMRLAWGNYLFALQLRRRPRISAPSVLAVLEECRERIGLRRPLTLVEAPELDSPALFGCFRLKLLLPEKMIERFSLAELRHVFLHELAHVRRGDAAVNWLTTILQTLHWFNPVLWFAFHRMRADRELACDELALTHAREAESKPYGQTVIRVLEGFTQPTAIPGLVGILEDKKQIKRRITMIAQFKKTSGGPVAALALVALLGCVSLTDGKKQNAGAQNRSGVGAGAMKASAGVDGQRVVRLVASDKVDRWVAFGGDTRPSPNGKYLSYINWDEGNLAFYNMETGELRDLTTEGTWSGNPNQFSWDGIWSPDSTQIAYFWKMGEKGELRIVHRDGGKPKTLVPAKVWPQSWSKDGRRILAVGPYSKAGPDSSEKVDGIQVVDALTGKTTMVKQLSDNPNDSLEAGHLNQGPIASLSPDGRFIAYSRAQKDPGSTNSAQRDIRIVNIDGSNDRGLIEHPANDLAPHWMPDGKHLLFVSDRSGSSAIWMLGVNNGQKAGEPQMVRDIAGRILGTADDGAVFYSSSAPSFNIYVAEADWDSATLGTPRLVSLRYDGKNRNPSWSSDGSRLGYVSRRDPFVLVFQDVATGKEEDVKAESGFGDHPTWSPDLSRLVARAKSPTQRGGSLFEVDVKSGRRSLLEIRAEPTDDVGYFSAFTPDGKHLIYCKASWTTNTPRGMVELDLTTRQERWLPKGVGRYGQPVAVSRDGLRLASCKVPYPAKDGDKIQVVVGSRTDDAVKTVAEFPIGDGRVYDWLPDNRRVIVSMAGDGDQQLYLVDVETGSSRPFGPPQKRGEYMSNLRIHPDGKRIAFDRGRTIQEIWAMKNFLPEDKLAAK